MMSEDQAAHKALLAEQDTRSVEELLAFSTPHYYTETVQLPTDLVVELEQKAQQQGLSKTEIIETATRAYLQTA